MRYVLGRAETPDRMQIAQRLLLSGRYARFVALGEDCFRRDAVNPDAEWAGLRGNVLRENFYAGFSGRVGDRRTGMRPAGRRRRDREDVSRSALLHARPD